MAQSRQSRCGRSDIDVEQVLHLNEHRNQVRAVISQLHKYARAGCRRLEIESHVCSISTACSVTAAHSANYNNAVDALVEWRFTQANPADSHLYIFHAECAVTDYNLAQH